MIRMQDHIIRETCAGLLLIDVIRLSLCDNAERIPFTNKGGFISTEIGESIDDEAIRISIHGFLDQFNKMKQTVSVICFDSLEKARRFLDSPEGRGFTDIYSDGKGFFEYTTNAGNPNLPGLITDILKNHFGFKDGSSLMAETHCEVDYFV